MSGRAPKVKGNRVERELVEIISSHHLRCKRAWGSSGRSLGLPENVDILIEDDIRLQSKAKKKLPKEMTEALENVDILVYRENGGRTLATVRLSTLLELISLGLPVERDLIFKESRDEQNPKKKKGSTAHTGTPEGPGTSEQGLQQAQTDTPMRTGLQIKR